VPSIAFPEQVSGPAEAQRWPARGPLGAGAFFYSTCAPVSVTCWPFLVMSDGQQYTLPMTIDSGLPRDLSLSPDGRYATWGHQLDGGLWIEDLQNGTGWRVGKAQGGPNASPVAWSPDSRLLLAFEHHAGTVLRWYLFDMRGSTWGLPAAAISGADSVIGVLDSGDVLVYGAATGSGPPVLRVLSSSGRELRRIQVTLPAGGADIIRADERVVGGLMSPCSCAVTLIVTRPGVSAPSLVRVDLGTGQATGRTDLPDEPGATQAEQVRAPRASLPGGIVLAYGTNLQVLNDVTGERQVLTRFPASWIVIIRGQGAS
jgi:hypothetical protein